MAPDIYLPEIHSAGLYFTLPLQSWDTPISPSLPQWAGPRPLPLNAAPSYRPLLGTEARPAVETSTVAIRAVASVHRLEYFCSSVSAIWTTHRVFLLSVDARGASDAESSGLVDWNVWGESGALVKMQPNPDGGRWWRAMGWSARVTSTKGLRQEFLSKYYES